MGLICGFVVAHVPVSAMYAAAVHSLFVRQTCLIRC